MSWISLSIFGDNEAETIPSTPENNSEGMFSVFIIESKSFLRKVTDSVKSKFSSGAEIASALYNKNYKYFMLFLGGGILLIILSLMMLPLVVIAPQKFSLFFSLGSLLILSSFAFLQDPITYFKSFFTGQNAIFSACYLGSLLISLYASLIMKKYIPTLLSTALQFMALLYYTFSKFPNGMRMISMLNSCTVGLCTKIFTRIFF